MLAVILSVVVFLTLIGSYVILFLNLTKPELLTKTGDVGKKALKWSAVVANVVAVVVLVPLLLYFGRKSAAFTARSPIARI